MMPPPPGLLSSTMVWPSVSVIDLPTARDKMSVLPPGAEITIMRIGLLGYGCAIAQCAQAATPMVIAPATSMGFMAIAKSGLQQRAQLARVGELLDVPHRVAQFARARLADDRREQVVTFFVDFPARHRAVAGAAHGFDVQLEFAAVAQF